MSPAWTEDIACWNPGDVWLFDPASGLFAFGDLVLEVFQKSRSRRFRQLEDLRGAMEDVAFLANCDQQQQLATLQPRTQGPGCADG